MPSKKTLNESNLEALGAKRLAELLIEISDGNAAAKRRLRLELAGAEGPGAVAAEIRKRLTTIARSRSFPDWQNLRLLVDDLETLRRTIAERVAKSDPDEGLELMWQFLELANSVLESCDDGSGTLSEIFHMACSDLGEIAEAAKIDPHNLADRAVQALTDNAYGQFDGLIAELTPALGQEGLKHLKQHLIALAEEPARKSQDKGRKVVACGADGPTYADEVTKHFRVTTVRLALMEIADAEGDVDAFIAQHDLQARKVPAIAAQIARRLLVAGRTKEAWQVIEAAECRRSRWPDFEWENARIDVLYALGRPDDAQTARLSCFERFLSAQHLRAYLKQLPDFDDVEAEERALDHAERDKSLLQALAFLVSWPALERAARVVVRRAAELNGDHYELLTPAADALAGKYPLAATLVLRAMIDFTLTRARSSRYRYAARHLMECANHASAIQDFATFETHEAYVGRLRDAHPRKASFWSLIS